MPKVDVVENSRAMVGKEDARKKVSKGCGAMTNAGVGKDNMAMANNNNT